jgi:hypothetical protein
VLERHLPEPDSGCRWRPETVEVWRRRRLTTFDALKPSDMRAVADAARPERTTAVTGRTAPHLTALALTVALAMTGDGAGWRGRRGRTGDALLTRGLPTVHDAQAAVAAAFEQRWLAGHSRDDIREAMSLSVVATERFAKKATPRWGYLDVTRALGWSPDNLRLRRNNGTFPDPDGTDRTRPWWWPDTVWAFVESSNLTPCPDCGALVARLRQHRRAHQLKVHVSDRA